jgi:hypothetical protein
LREPNLGKTNPRVSLTYSLAICFAPSLADSILFLNANPACSCVYICKFQFRPIHPPSRRLSTTLPLNSMGIIHSLSVFRIVLHFGIIFTHICLPLGESKKGLYFTHKYPFLAIHAKGGESMSPKKKDRTTTEF